MVFEGTVNATKGEREISTWLLTAQLAMVTCLQDALCKSAWVAQNLRPDKTVTLWEIKGDCSAEVLLYSF